MRIHLMNSNRNTDMQSITARLAFGTRRLTIISALIITGACRGGSAEESAAATPDTTAMILGAQDVAVAERADIAAGIMLTGSLQPADQVTIRAQVPGTVTNVRADRGTRVSQGQVLASIEAAGIRSQAAGARATVAAAEANLALARQQLEAARKLQAAGAMSLIELRSAEAQYGAAEAQLAAARAQSAGASETAERATITAPITGVVSQRQIEDGEAVSPGDELFTVVNSNTLELSGQIPVDQAARVRVGQPVVFTLDAAPEREYRGSVARVDPVADPQTRQVGVFVRLPNPGGTIVGGQFAKGRVVGQAASNAVVVPAGAVRQATDGPYVFVVAGDRIARRTVTLGARDEARGIIAIKSGVQPGERVLVTSTIQMSDGAKVTVANETQTPNGAAAPPDQPAAAPVPPTEGAD
jgi:membrane fusion protein, multidrug efflux system